MPRSRSKNPRRLLTPAALHILLTLADADQHGYAIRAAIEERTNGELELGPGTLYEALHRMVESKWIRVVANDDPRKKTYTLTPQGRDELDVELRRLDAIVAFARSHALFPEKESTR
jgi:DNA-binding PadR family transcriptional regulator